ncbi:MAG: cupin domain-containing protein [Halomonadaceae bacterium]|nr:MAG: cupin domain-containing protein [Halomonadaceae bacterium]
MQLLGGISVAEFLQDYWQKKPLLIRQAIPDMVSPVDANELAGLACEEGVESRLVIENDAGAPWQLHRGPFSESRFSELPDSNWTLLVQGLDHWVPEVADLLARFRFIPNWRVDDIMASYAPKGGSVGPHYDQYDVFLLQAEGHRDWRVGGLCDGTSPRVAGTPLNILSEFEEEHHWVLAPGDMLYLPPHLAHWGVAQDDCITLSVGFRAPGHSDILTGFTDYLSDNLTDDQRYTDPVLTPSSHPGAITPAALERLQLILAEHINDSQALGLWFGQAMTDPKHAGIVPESDEPLEELELGELINGGTGLRWNEGSRFAYLDLPHEPDARALFVDGERYILRGDACALALVLADQHCIAAQDLAPLTRDPVLLALVTRLVNQGSLYLNS